eukprot:Seg2100.5 transcript_id=Seg2100.5/GoldUCD/mRNA.D3Y31 product="Vesicle-fusing ATPase 1" protein_id=Seg2100.5/GoldUCD/D3Y31
MQYKVVKSPSEQLSLTNCVIVNKNDFNPDLVKFIEITWESKKFIFGIKAGGVNTQEIGFSFIQRKWTTVVLQSTVEAKPHLFDKTKTLVESMILDVDFLQKAKSTQEAYDTDKMATDFTVSFQSLPFTIGQPVVFNIEGKPYLVLTVKDLAVADPTAALGTKSKADTTSKKRVNCGILMSNTHITFEKAEESKVVLKGKARGRSSMPSIINPDWDFTDMGIGGLDKEFSAIFRRAFASRVFPPEVVEQFGLKHVKGILLFGPPGCGKTLMARQIGTMLNAREPKIVNGPEILNKYVGESEANIRNLFSDAITEQKQAGLDSGLHMIIFDEIDAICKQRGSMSGSTGVHDTVVNQLLSMIDGVEQLNNILVIGMTNRKDLIDEALLRPGRLEVQMEIGLPSQEGRLQILNIHTAKLRNEKKLSEDVSLEVLSVETKNFSGAEIEGLVRAAATTSMNKLVKVEGKVSIDPDAIENLKISREDFELALANDIKPSFGADTEDFENYVANGIVMWGTPVQKVFEDCKLLLNQTRHGELISPVSVLLEGCQGGGKTALAANLAQISDFPFIKICSPQKMVGYSETAKCQAIKKVFDDAYKSELSCVVVDDIERLIDYVPIGPRFSNLVLQALMVLLKRSLPKGRKLLIIGTTSCRDVLEQMQLLQVFNTVVHVPSITKPDQLMEVVKKLNYFDEAELEFIKSGIAEMNINIGIKKLLSLVEMAIQTDIGMRAEKFQVLLQEQSW